MHSFIRTWSVLCVLFVSTTLLPTDAHAQKQPTTDTVILPVRHVRGARWAGLLKVFVPRKALGITSIRYSPSLNKILVSSWPNVLRKIRYAVRQLDVPQAQFGVHLYFVRTLPAKVAHTRTTLNADIVHALQSHLSHRIPTQLVESTYLHVIERSPAVVKITHSKQIYAPEAHVLIENASNPSAVRIQLRIQHMRPTRSVKRARRGMLLVRVRHIQTRLSIRPNQLVVFGTMPWTDRSGKDHKVWGLIRVVRLSKAGQVTPNKLGGLSKKSIRTTIRAHASAIRACYLNALKTNPKLQGRVIVSFTINAKGRTFLERIRKSSLQHKESERCILSAVRTMRFPKPIHGGVVRVNYPFTFRPARSVRTKWNKDSIKQSIRKHQSAIQACYSSALRGRPGLRGKVWVSFTIDAQGKTTLARISKSSLQHKSCERCIVSVIRNVRFPKPPRNGTLRITYPFAFRVQ